MLLDISNVNISKLPSVKEEHESFPESISFEGSARRAIIRFDKKINIITTICCILYYSLPLHFLPT